MTDDRDRAIQLVKHLGRGPAKDAPTWTEEEFVAGQQRVFDAVYPRPCPSCGSREQETRPKTLEDGRATRLGWYCARCGADKGLAIMSPREVYAEKKRWHPNAVAIRAAERDRQKEAAADREGPRDNAVDWLEDQGESEEYDA